MTTQPTGHNDKQLDICFTLDVTGSMGRYIHSARDNIRMVMYRLQQTEGYNLRFGLVVYRDHPPQDMSFVSKAFAFTTDAQVMETQLKGLHANGGGDGPEAVEAGLLDTLNLEWRPNSTKICVLIADAPPHGLGEQGDGFPNGAPTEVDPFEVLDRMGAKGISVYSLGVKNSLDAYRYAKGFYEAASKKTNGQALWLGDAKNLATVILGGAIEEVELDALKVELVVKIQQLKVQHPTMSENDMAECAYRSLSASAPPIRSLTSDPIRSAACPAMYEATSLEDAKKALAEVVLDDAPPMACVRTLDTPCDEGEVPRYRGLSAPSDESSGACYQSLAASDSPPSKRSACAYRGVGAAAPTVCEAPVALEAAVPATLSKEQFDRLFSKQKALGAL